MSSRRASQAELPRLSTWGGARAGAGRKPGKRPRVLHRARPEVRRDRPLHATLRVVPEIGSLRTKAKLRAFKQVLRAMHPYSPQGEATFRVVHFSVQSNHVHLLVEAEDKAALRRGMSRLQIRVALKLNALASRKGRVFADRYHARALGSPRETRHALAYVLLNQRRHARDGRRAAHLDPGASGMYFGGWARKIGPPPGLEDEGPCPVASPETWLLRTGWRRYQPLISPDELPGPMP